jgi:hypothetical protein
MLKKRRRRKSTFPKNVGTKNVGTSVGRKERQARGRKRRKLRWALVGWKLACLSTF